MSVIMKTTDAAAILLTNMQRLTFPFPFVHHQTHRGTHHMSAEASKS